MLNSFYVGKLLHIIGLTMLAGTTLVSYVVSKKFWAQYKQDKEKGFAIMQAISKLPWLAGVGLGLQLISGFMIMAAVGGGYGAQLWFRIKMIFVLLIISGSIVLSRGMQNKMYRWVSDDMLHGNKTQQIGNLATRISYVQLFLISFFIIVYTLSVFRFN